MALTKRVCCHLFIKQAEWPSGYGAGFRISLSTPPVGNRASSNLVFVINNSYQSARNTP